MKTIYEIKLPEEGFLRLAQIIGDPGDPHADPPIPPTPAIIPVSKTTWFRGIKQGRFPKPVFPFGPRIACYPVETIRELLEKRAA